MLALLVIPLLIWLFAKRHSINSAWRNSVDMHLLEHLLVKKESRRRFLPVIALSFALVLAVVALAGPTWSKLPQSVYRAEVTRVLVLDLSRSMDVPDIKPSRLARAKFKVLDLLDTIKEGQVALIVYADEPYIVSPLTEDAATISAMVPTLITQLMPVQGSRLGLALLKAEQLLQQSGVKKGDIIVVTDGLPASAGKERAMEVAASIRKNGHRISVLGIGTREGAPIPIASGGFYKNKTGGIVIPKFDSNQLRKLVQVGGGVYSDLSVDDTDIEKFHSLSDSGRFVDNKNNQQTTDIWLDQGFWLLFILLPIALSVFRRGLIVMLCLVIMLPISEPTYAFEWQDLWSRKDQQAAITMQSNNYNEAAKLFENTNWKATALYRANEFEKAIEQYSKMNTAEANYNLGNALAKTGKIDEAISAYRRVLNLNAEHKDAKFNISLLEKMKKDAQQNKQDSKKESQKDKSQQGKSKEEQGQSSESSEEGQQSEDSKQASESNESKSDKENSGVADNKGGENKNSGAADSDKNNKEKKLDEKALQAALDQAGLDQEEKSSDKSVESGEQKVVKGKMSAEEERKSNEQSQEVEQWLSKIKDDPGGLLRQKFIMEYKRRRAMALQGSLDGSSSGEAW